MVLYQLFKFFAVFSAASKNDKFHFPFSYLRNYATFFIENPDFALKFSWF